MVPGAFTNYGDCLREPFLRYVLNKMGKGTRIIVETNGGPKIL